MKQIVFVKSLKATHFTGEIVQYAQENESILIAQGQNTGVIRSVTLQSKENLIWEVHFFRDTNFVSTTDIDADKYVGNAKWTATADGKQLAGAGQYYYIKHNLYIPYSDLAGTGKLHIALVNMSGAAKTAGTDGQVSIETGIELVG